MLQTRLLPLKGLFMEKVSHYKSLSSCLVFKRGLKMWTWTWMWRRLTQSRSRTWRRGRSRSPERSRTGRRRPGRWSGRRWDTSSSPSYHTDPPTPTPPPSWLHTPADLQTHKHKPHLGALYTYSQVTRSTPIMHTWSHWNTQRRLYSIYTHIHTHKHHWKE